MASARRTLRAAVRTLTGRPSSPKQVSGGAGRKKAIRSTAGLPEPWGRLLRALEVDLVLDVGAGIGQYGQRVRASGYTGRLVSFEPLDSARASLQARATQDGNWEVLPYALGASAGPGTLNVSGNPGSSSVLGMLDRHRQAAPQSSYTGTQPIQIRRLDDILDAVLGGANHPWLKLDVQGFELEVLRGAGGRLADFVAVQLELSVAPLYAGGPMRHEVEAFLEAARFSLAGVLQGMSDPQTGRMLQMDGLFVRADLVP